MAVANSKRYREGSKQVDKNKIYSVKEAISFFKAYPTVKFDESVELVFQLRIDPKKSEHMVRGTVLLPHGTGKKVRVIAFCRGESQKAAQDAGADYVGDAELINKVAGGWMDFDFVVATPEIMKDLSKLGKVLGPRGLMPSPKTGTVTQDVTKAIKDLKAGRVEFKADKLGGVHVAVGKLSFGEDKILENALTLIDRLKASKPASLKGEFIKSVYMSTTMGPGLRVSI